MSIKNTLRSWLLNWMFSEQSLARRRRWREWSRRCRRQRHVISVFLELDDPYSYLLSHYLPELSASFAVELRLYLTEALKGALRPAPELYPEHALRDCTLLAGELGIPFLDKSVTPPVEHRRHLLDALAARESEEDFQVEVYGALEAYWRGDLEAVSRRALGGVPHVSSAAMLARHQRTLRKLGHYNTAMLYYAGEWYWGVDRLHYLVDRLESLDVAQAPAPKIASIRQVMQTNLPVRPPDNATALPPLELFYSFRSPYSYLSLSRVFAIADAFGLELRVRPVLPMVMRGMAVPRSKLLYIVFDANREARSNGVRFGKIADPLGRGAERCLAVFQLAQSQGRAREFVLSAGEAVFGRAVDVATDRGLKAVCEQAGLRWSEASRALADEGWREVAEDNRRDMMDSGSWGVPTLRLGDFVTWGQDRVWLLAHQLEELCYDDGSVLPRSGEQPLGAQDQEHGRGREVDGVRRREH